MAFGRVVVAFDNNEEVRSFIMQNRDGRFHGYGSTVYFHTFLEAARSKANGIVAERAGELRPTRMTGEVFDESGNIAHSVDLEKVV